MWDIIQVLLKLCVAWTSAIRHKYQNDHKCLSSKYRRKNIFPNVFYLKLCFSGHPNSKKKAFYLNF